MAPPKPVNKKTGAYSKKAPFFGGQHMPPDEGWDWTPFKKNMSIETQLKLIVDGTYKSLIKENDTESYGNIIEKEIKKNGKQKSQSLLATLEWCNGGSTTRCRSATTCLVDILRERFTMSNYERLFRLVARLKEIIFHDASTVPAESKFIKAVKDALRDASFHDKSMTIEDRKEWIKQRSITKITNVLSLSINRKKSQGLAAQKRVETSNAHPSHVAEVTILRMVKKCKDLIAADIEAKMDSNALSHAMVLAQYCAQPRFRGIFTEKFSIFDANLFPTVSRNGPDKPETLFNTPTRNLLIEERITKTGSKTDQALKDKAVDKARRREEKRVADMKSGKEEADDEEKKVDDEDDDDDEKLDVDGVVERFVVKPMLPYITVEMFIDLIDYIRTHTITEAALSKWGLPLVIHDWSDALVRGEMGSVNKRSMDEFVKEMRMGPAEVVTEFFGASTKRRGGKSDAKTHFLRALGSTDGAYHFGENMKEGAYKQHVLNHKSITTSLSYGYVMIDRAIKANENLEAATSMRMASYEAEIAELKEEVARCCEAGKQQRGKKRCRDDDEKEEEVADAAGGKKKKKEKKSFALPRADGTFATIQPKKWGRVRGGTAAEKEAQKLADYTDWVNTVLKPAGVDMRRINQSHATLIGRRPEIITAYSKANGIPVQERRKK